MKTERNLSTTLLALCLLAMGCVKESTGGGTDSSSHWLDACEQDSDCGDSLSCHCNVCTLRCDETSECSSLGANAVCGSDWEGCGASGTPRICTPENEDSGSTTSEPSSSEPTSEASVPAETTETELDPTEATETESEPSETTELESDPGETIATESDAPPETTSDASANPIADEPTATETIDAGLAPDQEISNNDISACSNDDECIVVDYAHCCGATKRAINVAFEDEYAAHPEWQSYFDEESCASIGICRDDSAVTSAECARDDNDVGYCSLIFPEPGSTLWGEACQANSECQSNVCVRTAAPSGAFGDYECADCMSEATRDFACDEDADCCEGTCCLGCGEREGLCVVQ